jgi:aspartate racemase
MNQTEDEKVVGILGGLGPEATVNLMQRLIRLTPAVDDIDHIRCIVDNNPKVPSRIKAIIEGTGESPARCLADMARRLEAWGVDFLVIPCNTAHYYHPDVQAAVRIPVLNLIQLVVDMVVERIPGVHKAALLASPAIRITGLYEGPLRDKSIEAIYPGPFEQEQLLDIIKEIKAGRTGEDVRKTFADVVANAAAQGAEVAIVACTELGVIADQTFPLPVFDAAEILAEEIVAIVKHGKPLQTSVNAVFPVHA